VKTLMSVDLRSIDLGMKELRNYVEAIRALPLDGKSKERILGGTAAELLKA
jgi:hypothetical protein